VLIYWSTKQLSSGLEAGALLTNAGHSLLAATAAGAAALAAIVVALLSVRHPGFATRIIERVGYAGCGCRRASSSAPGASASRPGIRAITCRSGSRGAAEVLPRASAEASEQDLALSHDDDVA
jgi:hypothetical protein